MYLIAGIDPGTTKGIALINFTGRLVYLHSSKDLGLDDVITHIIRHGTASVIATDVTPVPSFVNKLATQLGAVVWEPREDISSLEKIGITREYEVEDPHQRDALAAALIAHKTFRKKFEKIESLELGGKTDEVKHRVLHGTPIKEAKETAFNKGRVKEKSIPEERKKTDKEKNTIKKKTDADERDKRLLMLQKQNRNLREQIISKDKEIKELEHRLALAKSDFERDMRKDSEIRKKDYLIREQKKNIKNLQKLNQRINTHRKIWHQALDGVVRQVGSYPLQKQGLLLIKRRLSKKELSELGPIDIAFTNDHVNREMLKEKGVITTDTSRLKIFDRCAYIYSRDINRIREESGIGSHKALEKIIGTYRTERT